MLRGSFSRRDISICAFCQHRLSLSLRPTAARPRPFTNTRCLAADGPSSSGWGAKGGGWGARGEGGGWGRPAANAPASAPRRPEEEVLSPLERQARARLLDKQRQAPVAPQNSEPVVVDETVKGRYVWNSKRQRQIEENIFQKKDFAKPELPEKPTSTPTRGLPSSGSNGDLGSTFSSPLRQGDAPYARRPVPMGFNGFDTVSGRQTDSEPHPRAQRPALRQIRPGEGISRDSIFRKYDVSDEVSNVQRPALRQTRPGEGTSRDSIFRKHDVSDEGSNVQRPALRQTRPGQGPSRDSVFQRYDAPDKAPNVQRPAPDRSFQRFDSRDEVSTVQRPPPRQTRPTPGTISDNTLRTFQKDESRVEAPKASLPEASRPTNLQAGPAQPGNGVGIPSTSATASTTPEPMKASGLPERPSSEQPSRPRCTGWGSMASSKPPSEETVRPRSTGWGSMASRVQSRPPSEEPARSASAGWGGMASMIGSVRQDDRDVLPRGPNRSPGNANIEFSQAGSRIAPESRTSQPPVGANERKTEDTESWAMLPRKQPLTASGFSDVVKKMEAYENSQSLADNQHGARRQRSFKPDEWNRKPDQQEQDLKTSATSPDPVSQEPALPDQTVVEPDASAAPAPPSRERDRDRERRQKASEKEEKSAKGRGKKGRRGKMNDEEASSRYDDYQERRRIKAERKAQRAAQKTGPTPIHLPELIKISDLADGLKIPHEKFLEDLAELGFEGVSLDSLMVGETAALVVQEYGYEPVVDVGGREDLRFRPPPADPTTLPQRPPVVTIMGHVDHGKTTLLDYLRKSSVVAQEHGGITQHIGAFSVKLSSGKPITFLDTPGHAAFLSMRQRGANVTDIVVLVVAADDSVKPQTVEALKHAQAAKVPIIVAINKIDKDGAQIDHVKHDLAQAGVEIEDFGGDVQVVCVSGKTGQGMDDLEENILTLSEILDHRAEVDGPVEGWVLESSLKASGKVATILVKRGTLRRGDIIAAGLTWARVRHLRNEAGAEIEEAPPGTPVEVLGWKDLPAAGDSVIQASDESRARRAVTYREGQREREKDAADQEVIAEARRQLFEKRAREKAAAEAAAEDGEEGTAAADELAEEEDGAKLINFVVKADVHGSVEAITAAIQEIGNHEVRPRVLRAAASPITEYDVEHAALTSSIIVNFSTNTPSHVRALAEKQGVRIMDHNVIYHLVDEVKSVLNEYLAPDITTHVLGEAEVLQVFPINIKGRVYKNVAGCRVRNGVVARNSLYRVFRKGEKLFEGKLETLKHVKKDVEEMKKGTECGIGFAEFQDLEVGDQIQAYSETSTPRTL